MRLIYDCLSSELAALCEKAVNLSAISEKVLPLLPEELRPHCKVGSFSQGRLVLTTTDAVWATPLRYLLPELRDSLRCGGFYQLSSLKVEIAQTRAEYREKPKRKAKPISEQSKGLIKKTGEEVDFLPLAQALRKLGQ